MKKTRETNGSVRTATRLRATEVSEFDCRKENIAHMLLIGDNPQISVLHRKEWQILVILEDGFVVFLPIIGDH
jgi:hypothetical protein